MKVNVFSIRLVSEKFASDQEFLNNFLETVEFIKSDVHLVEGDVDYWSVLIHSEEKKPEIKSGRKKDEITEEDLMPEQLDAYAALKKWRAQKSLDWNIPPFMICHNSELLDIVLKRPATLSDLRNIKGFGELKVENHGEEILAVLKAH